MKKQEKLLTEKDKLIGEKTEANFYKKKNNM